MLILVVAVIAGGCGGSSGEGGTQAAGPAKSETTDDANSQTDGPVEEPSGSPTSTSGNDSSGADDCGATAPCDPGTPHIITGQCGEVVEKTTDEIENSSTIAAEAYGLRALAKLCLRQDASGDLAIAQEHEDELTTDTRDALTAAREAGFPKGDDLRNVLREELSEQANP